MNAKITLSTILLCAAPAAYAQEVTSVDAGLTFSTLSADGDELNSTTLAVSGVVKIGQVTAFGSLSSSTLDFEGLDSLTVTSFGIGGEYAITSAFSAGLEFTTVDLHEAGYISSSAIFASYAFGAAEAGLAFGQFSADGGFLGEGDIDFVNAFLTYDVSDDAIVGLTYYDLDDVDGDNLTVLELFAELDTDQYEVVASYIDFGDFDLSIFALGGSYEVFENFHLLGEYSSVGIEDENLSSYSIGAGYEVITDLMLFASFGKTEIGDEEADNVAFGARYNVGKLKGGYQSAGGVFADLLGDGLLLGF